MKEVILGIGSNIGSCVEVVEKAVKKISNLPSVWDLRMSPLYQTSPVSDIEQDDYINLVCKLKTNLSDPFLFLNALQKIEKELGKVPKPKNAPRIIDIDILLYGDLYLNESDLEIPHPRMLERLFVLEPLLFFQNEIFFPISKSKSRTISLEKEICKIKKSTKQVVQSL